MQGYLWKRGHAIPTMNRRYCVLEGSMLACYTTEREHELGLTPKDVYAIREVLPWDGKTRMKNYEHSFAFSTLNGKIYQCSADTMAAQEQWIAAVQESLAEPYRIVAEEIVEAQKQLQDDVKIEQETADVAAAAVKRAEASSKAIKACEEKIKELKTQLASMDEKISLAQAEADAAQTKADEAKSAAAQAKQAAHDDMMLHANEEASGAILETAQEASRRLAMYEVEATAAATAAKVVNDLKAARTALSTAIDKATSELLSSQSESEENIKAATGAIHTAHSAKARTRLRLASWSTSPSHVDALAQGYLFCKHSLKPTMHSKYFVLYGKTLCWYKNADDFIQHANSPLGVVHVVGGISEWHGKVGLTTHANAFVIPTLEGKILHCSAPVSHDVAMWNAAFLIGQTMSPMSPERARAAKIRRDSFDLTSPPRSADKRASFFAADSTNTLDTTPHPITLTSSELVEGTTVEGYLVKQGHFVPTMKQKYCVLKGIHIFFYANHDEYVKLNFAHEATVSLQVACSEVAGVAEWDGHSMLMTYPHPFQIDTVNHAHIYCSAPTAAEKEKWMRGLRAAIARHVAIEHTDTAHKAAEASLKASAKDAALLALNPDAQLILALENLLSNYYAEHNPTKQDDIIVLTKLFEGREAQLLAHLDATYGTTLVADQADLITKFEAMHKLKLARNANSTIVTDSTVPHLEGIVEHLSSGHFGKGKASIYAVLVSNKFMHFATRIAALTSPNEPLETIHVADVVASTKNEQQFTIVDLNGAKHVYSAKSATQQQHWLHILQLGIEYARVHQPTQVQLNDTTILQEIVDPDAAPMSPIEVIQATAFKEALIAYYSEHNPEGLGSIDALMVYFKGKEHLLLESLDKMYSTNLANDPRMQSLCAELTNTTATLDRTGSAWRKTVHGDGALPSHKKEGYVKLKAAPQIPKLKRVYAVVDGTTIACYSDAMRDVEIISPLGVENVRVGDGQFSLYIDTSSLSIFCQLEHEVEFHEWLAACHVAIATQHVTDLNDSPLAQMLVEFYKQHNPSKVNEVPLILDSFKGREKEMLAKLDSVYHTQLSTDSSVLKLLPVTESKTTVNALVEGYFMKKGYMMPSMTRYYGVLRSNVLKVYDTIDDAQQDHTTHHPKELAAVTNWAAPDKFGLELITIDHRTYFCSFANEDEKLHWFTAIKHGLAMKRIEQRMANGTLTSEATKETRNLIVERYGHVSTHFAEEVDTLIEYAHGVDHDILSMIDKKYGTAMSIDKDICSRLEKSPLEAAPREGQLYEVTAEGQVKSELYGVLENTTIHFYASREGFKLGMVQPTHSLTTMTVMPWSILDKSGFVIDTQDEVNATFIITPNAVESQAWIDAIQCALDKAEVENLIHVLPSDKSSIFSSFLSVKDIKTNKMYKRYLVMDGFELKVFVSPGDAKPYLQLAVTCISDWAEAPPKCTFGLAFHCVNSNQKVCILHGNADTQLLKDEWINHLQTVQRLHVGDDLIQDQVFDVAQPSVLDDIVMKGYMMYEVKALLGTERREGYFTLHGVELLGFSSELAARANETPQLRLVINMLLENKVDAQIHTTSSSYHPTDFFVEAKLERDTKPMRFITATSEDRQDWVHAIAAALQKARGDALLATQRLLKDEATEELAIPADSREGFVVDGSSMEGMLTRVQTSYWLFAHDEPKYFVLQHQTLSCFSTKLEAQGNQQEDAFNIVGVSDYIIPNSSVQTGFKVHCRPPEGMGGDDYIVQLVAPSVEEKERWIRALKDAHDDGLREAYFNDLLVHQDELIPAPPVATSPTNEPIFYEGFVKIRRSHFTATWKEYYCVVDGSWFSIFSNHEAYLSSPDKPFEKHEVVAITDWHGSLSMAVHHVFRMETLDDGYLEISVGTDGEKVKWMKILQRAATATPSTDVVSRNASLSNYPGASMEGYLIKKGTSFRAVKKRYCVLLGTEWLYFNTQEDALANSQPLGVFKVSAVTPYKHNGSLTDTTVAEHAFVIETSAQKVIICEAHNGAERQLWMDAIQSQLEKELKLLAGLQSSKEKNDAKAASVRAAVDTLSSVKAKATSAISSTQDLLAKFQEDISSDEDEDESKTLYIEYADTNGGGFAPEDSPMRRTSKNKQHFASVDENERAKMPFWQLFCRCFYRPAIHTFKQDDPLLTEDEKRFYTCEFYANGTIDKSL